MSLYNYTCVLILVPWCVDGATGRTAAEKARFRRKMLYYNGTIAHMSASSDAAAHLKVVLFIYMYIYIHTHTHMDYIYIYIYMYIYICMYMYI